MIGLKKLDLYHREPEFPVALMTPSEMVSDNIEDLCERELGSSRKDSAAGVWVRFGNYVFFRNGEHMTRVISASRLAVHG